MADNAQNVTIRGRLSFPNLTYAEALRLQATSDYPKKDEDVSPSFKGLVEQHQLDKLTKHLTEVFLPWCEEQYDTTKKVGKKSALSAKEVRKITAIIEAADWEDESLLGLIYPIREATKELAPETVASIRVTGFKQTDIRQMAIVRSEDELKVPADDMIIPSRGLILPVDDTTHELYPGAMVISTLNLWAFMTGNNVGVTASSPACIFVHDAERFGGGGIDEDEIFMDLD